MNATFGKSTNDGYSAKNMAKPVNFYCSAPTAQSVCLVGDFNGGIRSRIRCAGKRTVVGLRRRSLRMVIIGTVFWLMANRPSTPAVLALLAMTETSGFLSSR